MKHNDLSKTWDNFPSLEVYVNGELKNSTSCHPDIAASLQFAESSLLTLQSRHPGCVVALAFGLSPNTLRNLITAV